MNREGFLRRKIRIYIQDIQMKGKRDVSLPRLEVTHDWTEQPRSLVCMRC